MAGQERTQLVRGPLAPYASGFESELRSRGYSSSAVRLRLWLFDHISRWLDQHELAAGDLTGERVEQFLIDRRADGYESWVSPRSMNLPLAYLHSIGVVAVPEPVTGDLDMVLEPFRRYLLSERGLTATTVATYVGDAGLFVSAQRGLEGLHLEKLSSAEVLAFVKHESARRRVASAQHLLVSLRSFLRYLHLCGAITAPLDAAVPAMARRRQYLPRGVEAAVVARLLASCDRRRTVGRRDYAILVLLARLGLRAGEVAALRLEDLDWRRGEMLVRGKGDRHERMPLPVDVGEALVAYLERGRPRCDQRSLFLRVRAPLAGLGSKGVCGVVHDACVRAGLAPIGAHRLRHTAATAMLRAGSSLPEVAAVLRHQRLAFVVDLREGRPGVSAHAGPALARGCGMTNLHAAVEDYLAIRRHLGFALERAGQLLPCFVDSLEATGAERVTTDAALAWAMWPPDAHPAWWAARLGMVRGFARYLRAVDPIHEVPPAGLLPTRRPRTKPYLYSDHDVSCLMQAARALTPKYRAAIYETLIGLLYVSGMRLGEILGLDRDDVDLDHGLLTIRRAKFNKDREIPVHPSTVEALGRYAELRNQHCPRATTDAFFVSLRGLRLGRGTVHDVFRSLLREADLQGRGARGRPRPHDFRHSFAVASLAEWYRTDQDPQARLPVLSTFLGHVDPRSTYWYLQATPELLQLAAQRLERVLRAPR